MVESEVVDIDSNHELYVHHGDPSNVVLSTQKLNGDNFAQWMRFVEISLSAKNKLGFVKGTCKKPKDENPKLVHWERCNNLVISWLLHSVEPSIANSILYCKNVSDI